MASIFFFTDVNYSRLDFATLYHKNIIQYVKFLEIILTVQKLRLNLLLSFFFVLETRVMRIYDCSNNKSFQEYSMTT